MAWQCVQLQNELLQSSILAEQDGLVHGFTVKKNAEDRRHFSFSVTDDWQTVRENRRRACSLLSCSIESLIVPAQTHGANVTLVGRGQAGMGAMASAMAIHDCDSLITMTPGIVLGVTVADCLAIFLYDPIARVIGLAHSGWRGTANGIAVNTLAKMMVYASTEPKDVIAGISPGISGTGYEVDETVFDTFHNAGVVFAGSFTPSRPGHYTLNLAHTVTRQLESCGVPIENIDVSAYHTDTHPDLLHSHRREHNCPRMLGILGMKD